ncbi:DUF6366 family protein [Salibacterium halotolerans]|uniref:Phage capsid protein n=1 Tax=Salibacterium halotolerans TaxID=1884432 RepID=A0A1I5S4L1_9BACI|nr:DUF6366 family protein [Salibacterium halotolerans]SFP65650.1 hypothetical protein SAMN05518683_10846 [Salibacterium halotolerans]
MAEEKRPDQKQEKMKEQERRHHAAGNARDGYHRAEAGDPSDLIRGLGWKGFLILIVGLFAAYVVYALFIRG